MINKKRIFTFVVFLVLVFSIIAPGYLLTMVVADTNSNSTMYLSFVHDGLGFYKVRNLDMPTPRQFVYDDRILNINIGDTIIWENDADITTFTIVSDQDLWNNKVGQIKVGHKINYKFDKSGTYTFYIKEASEKRQTIVVNNTGEMSTVEKMPTATVTAYPIPVPTATYKPSYTTQGTAVQTPAKTAVSNVSSYIPVPVSTRATPVVTQIATVPTQIMPDIKLPIDVTPTTIASMVVASLSIYITFRRRN
jgi:hypothetical protein